MKLFLTGGSGFIGTNFVSTALELGWELCNYDRSEPPVPGHRAVWKQGELLDGDALGAAMADFQPEAVLHLAARTECDENTTVEPPPEFVDKALMSVASTWTHLPQKQVELENENGTR